MIALAQEIGLKNNQVGTFLIRQLFCHTRYFVCKLFIKLLISFCTENMSQLHWTGISEIIMHNYINRHARTLEREIEIDRERDWYIDK